MTNYSNQALKQSFLWLTLLNLWQNSAGADQSSDINTSVLPHWMYYGENRLRVLFTAALHNIAQQQNKNQKLVDMSARGKKKPQTQLK